jgi:hypothetical protein
MTPASFDEVVFLDYEFVAAPGEPPEPVCMVAIEQRSGRTHRLWLERERPSAPPFRMGPKVLVMGYLSSAEWGVTSLWNGNCRDSL